MYLGIRKDRIDIVVRCHREFELRARDIWFGILTLVPTTGCQYPKVTYNYH